MTTTTASSEVTPDRSSPPGAIGALEETADRPGRGQGREQDAKSDEPALDHAATTEVATVRVEQQDPGHDAEPERQDDDREVLALEAERLLRERGPEDAEHADERGGDGQVDERPGDGPVGPDEANPSRSWPKVDPMARSASPTPSVECGSSAVAAGGGDAGRVDAEDRGQEVEPGHDDDDRFRTGDLDDQRAEQREADRERGVERQREDPVGGEQLVALDEDRDHRQFGRREEDRHRRDEDVEQEDEPELGADRDTAR